MELIVKIGADQAKLNETITRMKDQFRTMNTSMGGGMSAQNQAFQRYGSIMQQGSSAPGKMDGFAQAVGKVSPVMGDLIGTVSGLAGAFTGLGLVVGGYSRVLNEFMSSLKQSAMVARQSRITGLSDSMIKNVLHAGKISGVGADESLMDIKKMMAKAGEAMGGNKEAKQSFAEIGINPDGMTSDELVKQFKSKFEAITDPAKRAKVSKGFFGKSAFDVSEMFSKLDTDTSSRDNQNVEQLAAAKKRFTGWIGKVAKAIDRSETELFAGLVYKRGAVKNGAGESQTITADPEEDEKAKKEREKAEKERAKVRVEKYKEMSEFFAKENLRKSGEKSEEAKRQMEIEKVKPFAADSMAQAGLFTGSSLLFNPAMNLQQQQVTLLREISSKIGGNPFIQ